MAENDQYPYNFSTDIFFNLSFIPFFFLASMSKIQSLCCSNAFVQSYTKRKRVMFNNYLYLQFSRNNL